jgi:dihydrofolate reductase
MRKLIVTNMMSLDGYYEGPGKNVMALFDYRVKEYPDDDSFDVYNAERLRSADTLLLGHKSFQMFMGYWPTVADNPTVSPVEKEISRLMNAIDKIVVSDDLSVKKSDPWQNTSVVSMKEAHREIAKLKKQKGKDILIFASHYLWNDLLGAGLVDELHFVVGPVVMGSGTPIFTKKPVVSLRLIDSRTKKGAGTVIAQYKVSERE